MNVKLKDIQPNPFRGEYILDQDIVQALKKSILATGFWDNLIGRTVSVNLGRGVVRHDVQICYGHHRLAAMRELVKDQIIDEDFMIDVTIRKLNDVSMVKIMALDRAPSFNNQNCRLFDQTVAAVKKFVEHQIRGLVSIDDISMFTGGSWDRRDVWGAYRRLGFLDDGSVFKAEESEK